jgi:hypothetical protein
MMIRITGRRFFRMMLQAVKKRIIQIQNVREV